MIVAVTGNTGSGKTALVDRLVALGGRRIDADAIGRAVWEEDRFVRSDLARALGPAVLGDDGDVDRGRLGEVVFGDRAKLAAFDRIVQPRLRERIDAEIARAARDSERVWILDAALLFEWGLEGAVDLVVVVTAPAAKRAARIAARHGLAPDEAAARVASQMDESKKARRADRVVENDGSLEDLDREAGALWKAIRP